MSKEEGGPSKSDAVRKYLTDNPTAGAKVVQAALKEQGIEVSIPLVNKIKYAKPEGAPKASGPGRRGRPAAGDPNMSDEIRRYMQENPNATRPEIRDGLNAKGFKVSTSLVNAVYMKVCAAAGKTVESAPRGRRGRPPKAAAAGGDRPAPAKASPVIPAGGVGSLSAVDLVAAKKLIDQLGGLARMKQALTVLEQLS